MLQTPVISISIHIATNFSIVTVHHSSLMLPITCDFYACYYYIGCFNEASETNSHFFFTCTTYQLARQSLLNKLQTILGINTANHPLLLNTILEGHMIHPRHFAELLSIVFDYLSGTGRFY